jgi:hypothetical protein
VKLDHYRGAMLPAAILTALGCAALLAFFQMIPRPAEVLESLASALGTANLRFIAVCAFVENLVIVNAYFPGAFVILFAMAATHGDHSRALITFATIAGMSVIAQHVNFFVGRLSRGRAGVRTAAVGAVGGLLNYWHPQLGALYSFRSGFSQSTYWQFLRAIGAWATWTLFWGVLMYELGSVPLTGNSFVGIFVIYLVGWLISELIKTTRRPDCVEDLRSGRCGR